VVVNSLARNDSTTAIEYSGVIAIMPATIRVDTRYSTGRIAMASSASISSLIRIAPSCAVTPAPKVAASPIPAITGAAIRTLMNADRKPVSASMPIFPRLEYPCTARVPPVARVRKPTITRVPPIIASAPAPIEISAISRMTSRR
jgi:hypothetical protein